MVAQDHGGHSGPGDPRLQQAEERFRGLLEAAPDAIVIVGADGRIALVNAQAEVMFGYHREDLIGHPIESLVPDRFRTSHVQDRGRYITEPNTRPMGAGLELSGRRKDGTEVPVEISLSPLKTSEGTWVVSIIRDVSEQRRIKEALRQSRDQLQSMLDNTTSVIYAKDLQGRYILVNRRFESLFHVRRDAVMGKTDYDVFPRESADQFTAHDREALERGAPLETEEVASQDDGPHTYISVKFPLRDATGTPYAVCGISTDITERKRAEQQSLIHKKFLEEKIREMDDFTHVVSHDLKEPLRGIEAFSGFLLDDYASRLDEQGVQYLTFLKQAAVRMRDLIHDLLSLTAITRKDGVVRPVDVGAVLDQVKRDLDYAIRQKGVDLRVVGSMPVVAGDPTRIAEVFKNLISNAIKFNTSPQPTVTVTICEEPGVHVFSVSDNGIGIDPRYHGRIFELFERLNPQEQFEGTGAGLAICKKIIESHGGRIWVESALRQGSTFSFTLPQRGASA